MPKTRSSSVLDDATAAGAVTTTRSKLGLVALATAGALTLGAPGAFAVTTDPLHGYCAGAGQCIDNGSNSPTTTNPPSNFGFTISPGPASGDLLIDILTPSNEAHPSSFTLTGTLSGTATLVSGTAWTTGNLSDYLNSIPTIPDPHPASPSNPIGAYAGSTDTGDPTSTGFFVYQVDLGTTTLLGPSIPNVSPLENLTTAVPVGSYIVGFLNEGNALSPNWLATANSGAILDSTSLTPPPSVPEPASLALLGTALAGLGLVGRRRKI